MQIIGILVSLILLGLLLYVAFRGLVIAKDIATFSMDFAFEFLPSVICIPLAVILWQADYDNIGALIGIGGVLFHYFIWGDIYRKWIYRPIPHKCPKCGGSNTEIYDSKTDTYSTTRMETQQITHFNNDGDERGYSEYSIEVPSTGTLYYFYLTCKTCSHKWIWNGDKVMEIGSELTRKA